jgi:thiol-disulfide isomerase/thioredoxin
MQKKVLATLAGMFGVIVVSQARTGVAAAQNGACQELKPQSTFGRAIKRGTEAPPFELSDTSGKTWSLRELRGRPVLINFWATWCAPCRKEMPALAKLAGRSKGRLAVLTINVDEDPGAARRFLPEGTPLTVLLDTQKQVARRFGTEKFPETFLVDSAGRVQELFYQADWDSRAADACLASLR